MSPRNGITNVLLLPVFAATLIAARGLPVRHLLQVEACTDLSIKVTMSFYGSHAVTLLSLQVPDSYRGMMQLYIASH